MKSETDKRSYLATLLEKEIKEKKSRGADVDEFLQKSHLHIIDPDLNEEKLLSDTPDDELEQITLFALKKIVEKREKLVKRILNKETLKTKSTCFAELDGITHISL